MAVLTPEAPNEMAPPRVINAENAATMSAPNDLTPLPPEGLEPLPQPEPEPEPE